MKGSVPGSLKLLFWTGFIPAAILYVFRLVTAFSQHILWSLRRRLIVTYIFIAIVPILLILGLGYIAATVTNGQFAAFLVASRLKSHSDQLEQLNRVIVHEAHLGRYQTSAELFDHLRTFYVTELIQHASSYPNLEITLRVGNLEAHFALMASPFLSRSASLCGCGMKNSQASSWTGTNRPARHGIRADRCGPSDGDTLPAFHTRASRHCGQGRGAGGVFLFQPENASSLAPKNRSALTVKTSAGTYVQSGTVRSTALGLPPAANLLDFTVRGASSLDPILWGGEKEEFFRGPLLLYTVSRVMTLGRQLFSTLGDFSQLYLFLFVVIAVVFLVIEIFALVIGTRLTRSMTTTVDRLHAATERVRLGDFSHRIGLPARDQLSALGEAFDSMTASVERLLIESQEGSRLESELEIAREVQNQLFPQDVPSVPGLELYGVCRAARVVSGDYYDFLRLDENRVGVVLGDISGKGISAALLMASVQSAVHAQFYNGHSPAGTGAAAPVSTAQIVTRLNRQVQKNTPPEKYVTFFYAVYDAPTRKLTYTNAGHCPPVLFRSGKIERLQTGGTVVGLFSAANYEQAEVVLQPGDVLIAYTDGLVEPENSYEEEFGEKRLLDAVQRAANFPPEELAEELYRSVTDWTGSLELQDDLTLVVGKATC